MGMHSVIIIYIIIGIVFCVSMYVRCGVIVKAAPSKFTAKKVQVVTGKKEPWPCSNLRDLYIYPRFRRYRPCKLLLIPAAWPVRKHRIDSSCTWLKLLYNSWITRLTLYYIMCAQTSVFGTLWNAVVILYVVFYKLIELLYSIVLAAFSIYSSIWKLFTSH